MRMSARSAAGLCAALWFATRAGAADYPAPAEADYLIHDFKFASGESLPELRIHYRALGSPRTDAHGVVRNAVLIMHGTTGSGAQFIRPEFAGELFGRGQLLDATRFFWCCPMASATVSRASRATVCAGTFRTTATTTWCRPTTCC
jgi:hypothetical protein